MGGFDTKMEIKRYIPEITAVGLAEAGAAALAAKQALEGKQVTSSELAAYISLGYQVGMPIAIVINAVKAVYSLQKEKLSTPGVK